MQDVRMLGFFRLHLPKFLKPDVVRCPGTLGLRQEFQVLPECPQMVWSHWWGVQYRKRVQGAPRFFRTCLVKSMCAGVRQCSKHRLPGIRV